MRGLPIKSIRIFFQNRYWLIVLLILNIWAFNLSVNYAQCCDAEIYFNELMDLKRTGFIPGSGEEPWLTTFHNYLYPLFLQVLDFIGFSNRNEIGLVQFLLILISNFFAAYRLSKVLKSSFSSIFKFILLANLLAVYSYSGFFLTEALATVFMTVWAAVTLEMLIRRFRNESVLKLFSWNCSFAALAWMTRPSMIWVPMATLAILIFMELMAGKSRNLKFQHLVIPPFVWTAIVLLIALPQWLISMNNRGLASGVFKLGQWEEFQAFEVTSYRYLTNLSGCGPVPLIFSPFTQNTPFTLNPNEIWPPEYHKTIIYRIVDLLASFVSGWDAVPSPLTYVNSLAIFPWILLTLISGFIISVPFIATFQSFRKDSPHSNFQWVNFCLLLVFLVSQVSVAVTHGEFRFNLSGWIIGSIIFIFASANNFWSFGLFKYISISFVISLFILIVGQLTLMMSSYWVNCVPG